MESLFKVLSPKLIATLVIVALIYMSMILFGVTFEDISGYFQGQVPVIIEPVKSGYLLPDGGSYLT